MESSHDYIVYIFSLIYISNPLYLFVFTLHLFYLLLCFHNSHQLDLDLRLSCDISVIKLCSKTHDSWLPYHLCPSVHLDISLRLSKLLSSLTLCQYYSVIISGYQLGLFTLHFNPQLCISGYGHAWNNL